MMADIDGRNVLQNIDECSVGVLCLLWQYSRCRLRYDDTNLIHTLDNLLVNIALLLRSDTLPFGTLWSGIIHDVWRSYESFFWILELNLIKLYSWPTRKFWHLYDVQILVHFTYQPINQAERSQLVPPADLISKQMAGRQEIRFKRQSLNNGWSNCRHRWEGVTTARARLWGHHCSTTRLPTDRYLTTDQLQTGVTCVIQLFREGFRFYFAYGMTRLAKLYTESYQTWQAPRNTLFLLHVHPHICQRP
jgi:hypothetical protein